MPALELSPRDAAAEIKRRATELGFEAAGIAAVTPLEAAAHFEAWLAAGRHGEMGYLGSSKHRERRADPERLLRGLRSVVCVAMCHDTVADAARATRIGRIARYAAGEDYHRIMRDRLLGLQRDIESLIPGSRTLWYADTGAILERGWAERAGLGWIAKNACLVSPKLGSFLLLGELLVDRELEPDMQFTLHHCGTCVACIDACPTGAIVAPQQVDARLCISYLTIELHGAIPRELRPLIGDWIFGCDICQDVCPWNRFAPPAREARLHARTLEGWTLERFLELDDAEFTKLFAGSPIRRARRAGFLRNVCVALGNRREATAVPALLRALAHDPEPLVRGHAAWALGQIAGASKAAEQPGIAAALRAAAAENAEQFVREEAMAAASLVGADDVRRSRARTRALR